MSVKEQKERKSWCKKASQYFKALKLAKNTEGTHTFCSGDIPRARAGYHTEKKISFHLSRELQSAEQKKSVFYYFFWVYE